MALPPVINSCPHGAPLGARCVLLVRSCGTVTVTVTARVTVTVTVTVTSESSFGGGVTVAAPGRARPGPLASHSESVTGTGMSQSTQALKVAAVQLAVGEKLDDNLRRAGALIDSAVEQGAGASATLGPRAARSMVGKCPRAESVCLCMPPRDRLRGSPGVFYRQVWGPAFCIPQVL